MQSIDRNQGSSPDGPTKGKSAGERVADLHALCRADYGTGAEARKGLDRAHALRGEMWGTPATAPAQAVR